MKMIAIVSAAALLIGAAPAPRVSDLEFRELMEAVVAVSAGPSEVQAETTAVCVQRELEAPLKFTKGWFETFRQPGSLPAGRAAHLSITNIAAINRSITAALAPGATVTHQREMPTLPPNVILFSSTGPRRADCTITHVTPPGGWHSVKWAVALTFTQPAFANGFAFIDEYEDCPGLCGTTFLRVFKKQNGKWTQVDRQILSVS